MSIRFAEIADIERVLILEEQAFRIHLDKRPDLIDMTKRLFDYNSLRERIESDSGKIFLFVDEDNKIIGYCITEFKELNNHQILKNMRILEVVDLCIDEKFRRKGIGKMLFEEVSKYGKEKSVKFIELDVWNFNKNAQLFYEDVGMKVKTIRMELDIEEI